MRGILFILLAVTLGGCANSTLVVRGNFPGTAQIAAVAVNAYKCEDSSRSEKREARVTSQNGNTHVYVLKKCAQ